MPKQKTLQLLKDLDNKVQKNFDQILPQNLTLRYIVGLAIIGVLTLAAQVLIQISLIKLSSDDKTIRILESQSAHSESFYREIIRLQTVSQERDFKHQVQTMDKDIISLIDSHKKIMARINQSSSIGIGFPKKLDSQKENLSAAFDQLNNVFGRLGNIKYLEDPSLRMNDSVVVNFIKSENYYRDTLTNLIKSYEEESRIALIYFKQIQVIFLFGTLIVLILEGLYVFRPAVHRVYAAIQSRSDFLSRLSHEIRNPMNSILGMAQLLSKTKPTPQQKNYIKILENSSEGLLEMLNNLLDYSTLESSKLKLESISTDIYSVIEKTLDLVTTKIQEKGLELTLEIAPDVPLKILTDPIRLQQVLVNLLSNAVKFTESGFISCRLKYVPETQHIQFSIIDSGIGIEPTKVDSIFESFIQENSSVRRKYGGTGLGLTIAREIVLLMGGHLSVETKKNFGSNFTFSIPVIIDKEVKTINDYIPIRLTDKKYLLIDRNEKAVEYMKNVLSSQDAQLQTLEPSLNYDEVYKILMMEPHEKLLVDASTLGAGLEDFFIYLKDKNYDMSKICILFRYIHANYLFDLLSNYEIHSFFPKPIKPVEFINFLSGYNVENILPFEDDIVLRSNRRYKILIAEDSADNRTLLQIYLSKHTVDIYFAENGKKAVELFQQQKFDIVFMDIQMPEMDGISATKLIREYEKSKTLNPTPILAFSAHKPQDIFGAGEQVYFTDFVLKPINANIVRVKLKQYLDFSEEKIEERSPVTTSKPKDEFDVSDLIPSYLERRTEELGLMKEYIIKKDLKNLIRIGHQLKGSAKSYGFEELGQLGDQLEQLAQLEAKMEEIKAVVTKITEKITDYKKTHLN